MDFCDKDWFMVDGGIFLLEVNATVAQVLSALMLELP